MKTVAAITALLLAISSRVASAVPVVDQAFGDDPARAQYAGLYFPNYSDVDYAQTFTAGLTGKLTSVGLWLESCCPQQTPNPLPYPLAPLEIRLVRTVGGVPSLDPSDVLATELVSQATVDSVRPPLGPNLGPYLYMGWLQIDLAAQPEVAAGDVLAIVLERYSEPGFALLDIPNDNPYAVAGYEFNPSSALSTYLGGEAWAHLGNGAWMPGESPGEDMFFATWVEPQAVPEPGAAATVSLSLIALLAHRAGRRSD